VAISSSYNLAILASILLTIRIALGFKFLSVFKWRTIATILAISILLWIQGNIFIWDYGQIDGAALRYDDFIFHGIFEILLWGSLLIVANLKPQWLINHTKSIVFIVFISLIIGSGSAYYNRPKDLWFKKYEVVSDNYFKFSSQKNVILIIIDAARADIFKEILSEMTNYERDVFDGFTFFEDTTGTFNATNPAMSGILTGKLYNFDNPRTLEFPKMFTSETSIPYQLKKSGFISEIYPYNNGSVYLSPEIVDNLKSINDVIPKGLHSRDIQKLRIVTKFNFMPHFAKKYFFDPTEMYASFTPPQPASPQKTNSEILRANELQPSETMLNKNQNIEHKLPASIINHINYNKYIIDKFATDISFRQEPVFKVFHFHGAHHPFFHDENYKGMRLPISIESYKKQYKGSLFLTLKALVGSLKKAKVYDETMLIVIGDHGSHIPNTNSPFNRATAETIVSETLTPLFMIKPFGNLSSSIHISSAPVSLFDLAPTVLKALSINETNEMQSAFDIKDLEKRKRFAYSLAFSKKRKGIGAIEYQIDNHTCCKTTWQPTLNLLRPGEGRIAIEKLQLDLIESELSDFLGDIKRYEIKD
jgi:hypothetical protein